MEIYKSEKKDLVMAEEKAKREKQLKEMQKKTKNSENKKRMGRPIMARSHIGPDVVEKEKSVENEEEREFNRYFRE